MAFDPKHEDALNDLYQQIEQLDDRDRMLLATIVVQSLKDETFIKLMGALRRRYQLIDPERG